MRKSWRIAALFLLAAFLVVGLAKTEEAAKTEKEESEEKAAPPKYVGVAKCKVCHKNEKKGDQFGQWEKSKHAHAFHSLATDESKALAKKMGIDDPLKSEKCLKCHVTGHGQPAMETLTQDEGVSCESCHGPGENYKVLKVMKDHDLAVANGLVEPTEELCVSCHNKESPTYKEFKYEAMLKQVVHPNPAKQKAEEQKAEEKKAEEKKAEEKK